MRFVLINGPNLNLLGKREPDIYGSESFEQFLAKLRKEFPKQQLEYFQSNNEGALIDKLHEVGFSADGIVINGGGFSHTSVALADAIAAIETPVVSVHISNTLAREAFRHTDLLSGRCVGSINGLGMAGYAFAIRFFLSKQ